jgi:hypothetical protein
VGSDRCILAIGSDSRLHLLVRVDEAPEALPPDLQSIVVRVLEGEAGVLLDVSARSHHELIFTTLVNMIVEAVEVQRRAPAAAVDRCLDDLRAALRPVVPDLGVSEQIGLFGELWVLGNVLIPTLGPRACLLWSGPHRERHDFVGERVHIEVKTTTGSEERHEITRLDQLRAPLEKRLLLASVMLERTIGGADTVATMIDLVVTRLGSDGRAIAAFEEALAKVGWHEGLRQTGALLRFNLRDVHFFEVTDDFPRLPDDYVPPRGVVGIRYAIDVAARPGLAAGRVSGILRNGDDDTNSSGGSGPGRPRD